MQLIKKYLHFNAETIKTNYSITSETILIPVDLFENSTALDCYVKGFIYSLIQDDNKYKNNNINIFIKIIDYELTDYKVI